MNNKKLIISFSFITILFVLIINMIFVRQNNLYKQNYNNKINEIVYKITLDYKDITKKEFLITCQKEIDKINFLIKSLLKLSRFDVNVVKFNNKNYKVTELINKVIDNVGILCDLKNIKININITNDYNLYIDLAWQVEALTNIVKNCIEHSNINGIIDITCSDNKVYSKIEIKDYGTGINKEDLNHIFERFYKGKNTSSDGVGIGLSLAKKIIETNNGKISVISKEKCYTIFEIKYFK